MNAQESNLIVLRDFNWLGARSIIYYDMKDNPWPSMNANSRFSMFQAVVMMTYNEIKKAWNEPTINFPSNDMMVENIDVIRLILDIAQIEAYDLGHESRRLFNNDIPFFDFKWILKRGAVPERSVQYDERLNQIVYEMNDHSPWFIGLDHLNVWKDGYAHPDTPKYLEDVKRSNYDHACVARLCGSMHRDYHVDKMRLLPWCRPLSRTVSITTSSQKEKHMLIHRIKQDRIQAMRDGDAAKRATFDMVLSAANSLAKNSGLAEPTDEQTIAAIRREVKAAQQNADNDMLPGAKRVEARAELALLGSYLPPQASEQDLRKAIFEMSKRGVCHIRSVMSELDKVMPGAYDKGLVARLVKEATQTN